MDTGRVLGGTDEKLRKDRLVSKMTQNKSKPNPEEVIVRDLKTVISLLKQYEAKSLSDMKAESVSRWLVLFASYPTGLLTFDGHIDIDALPGVSKALVRDFKAWKAEFWDSWPDRDWAAMPKGFDRAKHNLWGRQLGKDIRSLIPMEIEIEYVTIVPEDESKQIRNICCEKIELPIQEI